MDPHLAQVLKALQETTSGSQPQNHQLSQQSYDPRRIYQPDIPLPQPVQAPQAYIQHASPPLPASERVDPRTITQWPAALKYITTVITTNPAAMERLKKTPETKLQELQTYDEKVYRASVQMYGSMAEDLKSLGIPFFVITEEEFPGDKDSFLEARKKVIELIDDLT
ncbi:hypothetical protein AOL_s00097g541 [Orbilia oligospora ATCC 24927]|uniref:Uncharacterized protein n=1 Tax=Arthrobotrys oligospora (strain ATCC 24927 / CBS 115.81 / DSM 1491) TaxID=756982 RepID=G1XJL4_ARTOA|nr:hypothetical protein AOL_s00097g541 [Orbilia oligospora ATCC 24927]EGX46637.1 hypothetical protein AOL_s00097g541 [Orbilia oligospora ATCC 24927]